MNPADLMTEPLPTPKIAANEYYELSIRGAVQRAISEVSVSPRKLKNEV